MSLTTEYSYVGKGHVFLQRRNIAGAKMVPIGNCLSLQYGVAEDKKELQDFTSAGGGVLDTLSTIKSVTAKMKVSNLSAANIAIALRGGVASQAGAAVADEAHADIALGSLVELARLPDLGATITVKKGATVVASAGNWQAVTAGIWIAPDAVGLTAGDDITVTYAALADDTVQALVEANAEYTMLFSGLNEARSGRPVVVKTLRVKFSPTKALDLIGDKFGELDFEVDALSDPTVVGTGLSKFMTVRMASAPA